VSTKKIHVLLVDDDDDFRGAAAAILRRRGFQITGAASGAEALDEIRKGEIDVVVLDVKMPVMDGHETYHRIEKLRPDIQVIMLTGYGTVEPKCTKQHEGVFEFLKKPCDIDFLVEKIRQASARKKL
jgi:DNA-binding NtrC family response regulator